MTYTDDGHVNPWLEDDDEDCPACGELLDLDGYCPDCGETY